MGVGAERAQQYGSGPETLEVLAGRSRTIGNCDPARWDSVRSSCDPARVLLAVLS